MHSFNATVRLQGSVGNEVDKYGLTVPEIIILQHLHGTDAVTKLVHVGTIIDFDDLDERERLKAEYDEGLSNLSENLKTSVEKIFGGEYNPLPNKLRGFKGELSDDEGYLEDFQESPHVEMEDVGVTPMEKARQRRAEAGKRALAKREAAAKDTGKKPEVKVAGKGGKSAIEAAL